MAFKDGLIAELKHESAMTKKILERVPLDKKDWKPHEKSMTIGRLATHIAECVGWTHRILNNDVHEFPTGPFTPRTAATTEELLDIFQKNLDEAIAALETTTEEGFDKIWTVKRGGQTIYQIPKKVAVRGWGFNHVYHHRGQLSVDLRLLDVAVPGMYGPSADEK